MSEWHVSIAGQQRGPYEESTLRDWHASGRLPDEALVWAAHLDDWRPITSMFGPGPTKPDLLPPPPPGGRPYPATAGHDAPSPTETRPPMVGPPARPLHVGGGEAALAPLGRRLGGVGLDAVIPLVVYLGAAIVGMVLTTILGDSFGGLLAGLLLLATLIALVVWPILALGRLGQTYGKHLAGVKVVSAGTGLPIGGGSSFLRGLVQGVGAYALGLGWFWALWDPQQQGWHDKVVNSVVVDASDGQRVDPWTHLVATFRGRW